MNSEDSITHPVPATKNTRSVNELIYDDVVSPVLDEVNDLLSLSKTRVKGTKTVKGFPRYKLDAPVNPQSAPYSHELRKVVETKGNYRKSRRCLLTTTPNRASDVVISDDYVPITVEAGYRPDDMITIYRGTVEGQTGLNNGDWVTINKQLAKDYSGNGRVIEAKVKASELYAPKGEGAEELIYSTNKSIGADNLRPQKTSELIKEHLIKPEPKQGNESQKPQTMFTVSELPQRQRQSTNNPIRRFNPLSRKAWLQSLP